jgi:hypothetical protein
MPRLPERLRALLSLLALPALLAVPVVGSAQAPPLRTVLPKWIGVIAAPGHEQAATTAFRRTSPAWQPGPLGTLVSRSRVPRPRRGPRAVIAFAREFREAEERICRIWN